MGVYIKDMEMPMHCSVCKFFDHGDCELLPYGDYIDDKHKRRNNCPLIEVPPHGDLIDRDALIQNDKINTYEAVFAIANAPNIIEADSTQFNNSNALDALESEEEDG